MKPKRSFDLPSLGSFRQMSSEWHCGGLSTYTMPKISTILTGLTTGAITGVVDRLESAGFVRRATDPSDRRRVIIAPVENSERGEEIAQIFGPLAQATVAELVAHYSDEELVLILDFVHKSGELMKKQTALLRQQG